MSAVFPAGDACALASLWPRCTGVPSRDRAISSPSPMPVTISSRLAECVDALPLRPGVRVLEIGCGPGVAARAVLRRLGPGGHVLAIDRSVRAIEQAIAASPDELATGRLECRVAAVEDFELRHGERPYDLAFALRVGALDGRHPEAGRVALDRLRRALATGARPLIDGGDPLREIRC